MTDPTTEQTVLETTTTIVEPLAAPPGPPPIDPLTPPVTASLPPATIGADPAVPAPDEPLPTLDPATTVAGGLQLEPGVTRIVCPSCGTVWEGNDLRPHAAWFCATCDFPLFWARAGGQVGESSTDDALARLPGTGGRTTLSSLACPVCGELNPPVPSANCWRCGSPLTPRVAPEQPLPVVVATPVIEPSRRLIWPWVLTTCVLSAALIVLLILLLRD